MPKRTAAAEGADKSLLERQTRALEMIAQSVHKMQRDAFLVADSLGKIQKDVLRIRSQQSKMGKGSS